LIVTVTTPRASLVTRTVDSLIASCRRTDYPVDSDCIISRLAKTAV
jgi:hypothetical protein